MATWQIEIDGKVYEIEGGNTPPSEQQARQAVGQFREPNKFIQSLQKPAATAIQTMQQLPGAKQYLDLERNQAQQRSVIQNALYNKMGGKFPVARGIAAGALDYATPSNIIASGLAGYGGSQLLGKAARIPATRRFLSRQTPTFSKSLLQKTPIQPQYKTIRGQRVDVTKPLPTRGNVFSTDYITQNLLPKAQQAVKTNIQKFTPGIERFAREKLKISQSAINTIKSKGVGAIEAVRNKLGNDIDNVYKKIINGVENKRLQADTLYRDVVNNFKGTIDASQFRVTLGNILRGKGWIDKTGKPTGRFSAKLDPVLDDLTRLHQDLRTIYKGKNIKGFRIPKEDFSTYRDMLGRLLKDRPSDRSIMQLRNALYNSAERSGMKGIVRARDLERIANKVEQELIKKGLVGEKGLNRFHSMTKEQLRDLREIEYYIQEPFIDDLASFTAAKELDKVYSVSENIPGRGNMLAEQLMQATDPRKFNFIKNNLRPFLGNATEIIFKDLSAHRFATGLKTAGKYGAGVAGGALAYNLLNRPIKSAIEGISSGGEVSTGGGY